MRSAGLPSIAIETFRHYYEQLSRGGTGMLAAADIEPVERLPDADSLSGAAGAGESALSRCVVIKLNGGLGTSMGMAQAKSLLRVRDGLSFLEITAKQILRLRERHGGRTPLLLMNSFRTRDDSLAALRKFPELASDVPADFLQHRVPKILAADLSPARSPRDPAHEWCPPGHGDIYTALLSSGTLDALLARGYEYAFVSNSDNLGAVLDLEILGWFARENIPFLMEVADRTEADKKGGHLARRKKDGGLVLREVAQCPPGEIDSFQDVRTFRYFNTNTLWVNLRSLDALLRERRGVLGLPMIRNEKTLDPTDDSSPKVIQLETAMGAAISVLEGAAAIRVPRSRFLPVKTTNDLLCLWSDAYVMTRDWQIVPAPDGTPAEDRLVDLDPRFYRRIDQLEERFPEGAPSLVECRRLVVRGDIRFGAGVTCRGDVRIAHEGPEPRLVPDGAVLS
ncbi:MAG: UTP--glucose-1-phosphate uridylyltransferase [bacterium]